MASIKHLFHISTPREKVYKAISTTEGIAGWWTTETTGESKVGGIITFKFGAFAIMKFKVTELKANEKISMECLEGNPDWIGTTVTLALDENDGKTRIRFEHAGWKETGDHYAACCFSWGRYMLSMRQLLEKGKGFPFPEVF